MSSGLLPTGYPPSLTEQQQSHLVSSLKDWSLAHGLAVRPSEHDPSSSLATTAPVTLFPSLFPRVCFQEATAIQAIYNELYAAIAMDEAWLGDIIKGYGRIRTGC